MSFPGGSDGKESACNAGDLGSIPELGRSPGEGRGFPLQYSGLEIHYTVHGVAKRQTWLSNYLKKEKTKTFKIQYIRCAVFHSFGLSVISLMVPHFWWSWTFFPSKKTTARSFYTLCNRKSGLSCPGSFPKLRLLHPCGGAPGHCPEGSASVLLLTPERQTGPPCRTQFSRLLFWKITHIFFLGSPKCCSLLLSGLASFLCDVWPF